MGHRDETERTAEEAVEERALHRHPADPDQVHEGFETGYDQERDTPEEELGPNFARGIAPTADLPEEEQRHGRFSTGEEELPESDPEKHVERRFSEGIERDPTST